MPPVPAHRPRRPAFPALVAGALALVVACADPQQRPAARAIADIEAALAAAGTGPARFIPGDLQRVQARVDALQQRYAQGAYGEVVAAAPSVLAAARALGPDAAARAAELERALQAEWGELVRTVPAALDAARTRLDRVATGRTATAASRIEASTRQLADADALWQRALQEQAARRLPEAVTLAHQAGSLARRVETQPGPGAAEAPLK